MRTTKCYPMTSMFVCVIMVLLFTLNGCSKEVSNSNANLPEKLDEYVNAFNEAYSNHKINGSIIIAKEGKIVASRSYGMADFENNRSFTQDTRSMLCSTTKFFTAIGIMQLNEKELLTLDDKVSKYIPCQYRGDDISIRNLLTHTSGITRDVTDIGIISPYQNTPKEKLISMVNERPLIFEPGTNMSYSNEGYQLLAYIIEKASGMSYEEYIEKNILKPSGMKASGLSASKMDINNLAIGYEYKYNRFNKKMPFDMSHAYGSGNIYSTTYDMYLFDKALMEERLLKKETLDKMICDNTGLRFNYGYGCFVGELKGHRWFGHAGNLSSGYFSYYVRFPEDDLAVIMLFNTTWDDNSSIMKAISAIALGEKYMLPHKREEIELDKDMLEKFAGKYKASGSIINGIVTVKNENGYLVTTLSDKNVYLTPYSKMKFFIKSKEMWEHNFETDKSGRVTCYVLSDPVDEIRMNKVE